MTEVDKDNFDDVVLKNEKPVLVDFWGPGCARCIQLMPQMEKLAEAYKEKILFVKLNIQGNRRLAMREQVLGLPTFLIYKDGAKIVSFEGGFTMDEVKEKLKEIAGEVAAGE